MLRIVLFLLLLSGGGCLLAQSDTARLKGLLWEISGNGLMRPGYLYGTMHVPEKLAFNLSDSFFVALHQVDMVALETDHDQWQAFTEQLSGKENELLGSMEGALPVGRRLNQPDLYNSSFRFQTPDNQLLGAMLSAKPRMTNEFLYRSNQYRQDYEEDTYLDLFIFQAGRKLGKTVIGLETLEDSYEAFIRAQLPDSADDDNMERNRYAAISTSRISLDEAYRDQDLDLLDSLNKMAQPGKNFQRWMQDERNLVMVRRIDSILQSGRSLFSAVGAAHLPGATGLIRMLRQKGYSLRPVQFSANTSKRDKEQIEALHYPVGLTRQWAADSSWSAEAPGKFYQTVDAQGLEQQLCADMSNGAYYAVYRLRTFGAWNGQAPEFIIDRIDSLIYEKIPGKILERKRSDTPFPNHTITTRTRRGDILRFRIFATPMELFLFATGGNGDYAAGESCTQFLNSIQFYLPVDAAAPNGPTRIQPPGGGFEVLFPAPPTINTTGDKNTGRCLVAAVDPEQNACYLLCRVGYHDWDFIEEDTFELNIIGEKIAAQYTTQAPESRLVTTVPYPMQDVWFRSGADSAYYYLRLIINGPQYYLLGCRKLTPGAPQSFFESFSVTPARYPGAWETMRDTNLMFEARVPEVLTTSTTPFLAKLQRLVAEGLRNSRRNQPFGNAFPRLQTRLLELPLQEEQIWVQSVEMMAAGTAPTLDSFERAVKKRLTNQYKLALAKEDWQQFGDSLLVGQFLLEDTNSTRSIRVRLVVTPGRMYNLYASGQLQAPPSDFVQSFFESFSPIDTTRGALPFGRRDLQFLQNIYASDSLVRIKALARVETTSRNFYDRSDAGALQATIEHPAFGQLEFHYRESLLLAIGQVQTPEATDFLLKWFDRYPDSAHYRQTVLVALAHANTAYSLAALAQLLRQQPVYLTDSQLNDIFVSLSDTLALSASYLPPLLDLVDELSFRPYLLQLLLQAVQRRLIRPKTYARLKPRLAREAGWLLSQRQYASVNGRDIRSDIPSPYYAENFDAGGISDLRRTLGLLAPFLPTDKRVQAVFAHALESPDHAVQLIALTLMLRYQQPVPPEQLRRFATDDRTRHQLYCYLAEAGQLRPYLSWFADTIALVRSILLEERADVDSARFISRHRTWRGGSPAELYFFEVQKKKGRDWFLAYVLVPEGALAFDPESHEQPMINPYLPEARDNQGAEVIVLFELPEKEKAGYMQKKIGEIRFAGRERYLQGGREYNFGN